VNSSWQEEFVRQLSYCNLDLHPFSFGMWFSGFRLMIWPVQLWTWTSIETIT
jgi:hypothetical protein